MPNVSVAGYYKIIARDKDTNVERVLVDWFPNLITEIGMERLAVGNCLSYCSVGSGSTPPTINNTGLQSPIAVYRTASVITYGTTSVSPYYGWKRCQYDFVPGEVTGNLSEVSIGWDNNNTTTFSRSLIQEAGLPITVTVLPNDYLTVIYELRLYLSEADTAASININGTDHACVIRPAEITTANHSGQFLGSNGIALNSSGYGSAIQAYSGDIGTIFSHPAGTSYSSASRVLEAYSANSRKRSFSYLFGVTQGNIPTGIKSIWIPNDYGSYQISFDPPIQKDNTKTLSLSLEFYWSRYTP